MNGRAEMPNDPIAARFVIEATVRREFPYITDEAFAQMTAEDLRYHLAYLEGIGEGNRELQEQAKSD